MSNLSKDRLLELVEEFLAKVPSIKRPERREFYAADFDKYKGQPGERWPEWAAKKGVYYLLSNASEVLYVGEGTSWAGVVDRVKKNIKRFEKSGLSEKTTKVEAVLFEHSDYYWALALERFLIDSLEPPLNKPIQQW